MPNGLIYQSAEGYESHPLVFLALLLGHKAELVKCAHFAHPVANLLLILLIFPDVLTTKLLPAWQKATSGARADRKSLIGQLTKHAYLKFDEKEQRYAFGRRIEGKNQTSALFRRVLDELKVEDPPKNPTRRRKSSYQMKG